MSAQQFVNAAERVVELGALVRSCRRHGKKTAERLIVENESTALKGYMAIFFTPAVDLLTSPASPTSEDAEQEAVAALVARWL